jgi:hypothetical protein
MKSLDSFYLGIGSDPSPKGFEDFAFSEREFQSDTTIFLRRRNWALRPAIVIIS